jgi:acetyltransferase-like isoleucine patch superfamily enzyme
LVDGQTNVSIEKNAQINGPGYLSMGINHELFFPSTKPCALKMLDNSKVILNGNVDTGKGVFIETQKNAVLEIGQVGINSNTSIICSNNIKIGEGTGIGWDVEICDTSFHQIGQENSVSAPITIGRHVLVCSHCVIMKGVSIGDGAVIATGSIVSKDIPPGCLAGGVPARVIKENIEWK